MSEHDLPALLATRRAKLEKLRSERADAFPPAFPGVTPVAEIQERYGELAVGEETGDAYRVAGRLAARRGAGKLAFLDLVDRSGRLQLQARVDELGEQGLEALLELDLGDLLGVDGTVMRSRRGELTLRVREWTPLAKSLRPPPDKFHGLADTETRFRKRELDLLANEDARRLFIDRARIVRAVRGYLDDEGFLELETPVLQPLYGGALARPFTTHHNALDRTLYLRIATELYLKRAIVGGLERVYELGKDFRNEGLSPKHNPEFTMVEWYEAYADYLTAAERLEAVVRAAAAAVEYRGPLDVSGPWRRLSFRDAVREATGVDVLEHRDADSLRTAIEQRGLELSDPRASWPELADELLSKHVEPRLQQPTFVLDYPVELSPFARAHRTQEGLAERWEAFAGGMEIANAFSELADPDEQRRRFEAQQRLAGEGSQETQPYDEGFVEALEYGMPPTGGVGLGIDRLVMVLSGRSAIREVVLFPAMR